MRIGEFDDAEATPRSLLACPEAGLVRVGVADK
jgi:hypothetical protein